MIRDIKSVSRGTRIHDPRIAKRIAKVQLLQLSKGGEIEIAQLFLSSKDLVSLLCIYNELIQVFQTFEKA